MQKEKWVQMRVNLSGKHRPGTDRDQIPSWLTTEFHSVFGNE